MVEYYTISAEQLGKESKVPLLTLGDSGEVFYELALEMINEIEKANAENRHCVFIVPVGPIGQYPIFVRLVNEKKISLKNCYFINMDEYVQDNGDYIDLSCKLSFRAFMQNEVYNKVDSSLVMDEKKRIFPDPKNLGYVSELIEKLGGVDIAFGGIGINGHLAFNEPQPDLSIDDFGRLQTRVLDIAQETRTTNCIGDMSGALESFPKRCVTVGMKEILGARKIRLGVFRDWHRAVIRRVAYGSVSSSFPASLLQQHPDVLIFVNSNAAKEAL